MQNIQTTEGVWTCEGGIEELRGLKSYSGQALSFFSNSSCRSSSCLSFPSSANCDPQPKGPGSYFLGRPLERCLRFINSASSTIQKLPKSSSYRTKHLWSDKLVRMAFFRVQEGKGKKKEKLIILFRYNLVISLRRAEFYGHVMYIWLESSSVKITILQYFEWCWVIIVKRWNVNIIIYQNPEPWNGLVILYKSTIWSQRESAQDLMWTVGGHRIQWNSRTVYIKPWWTWSCNIDQDLLAITV